MNIRTNCKDCIFFKDKDCSLGRYNNFEKNGASIQRNEDNVIVDGRYCSALRTEKWSQNKDPYNLPVILRAELLISTEVLVYLSNDNYNDDALNATLNNLQNQLLKPNQITLVCNQEKVNYVELIKKLKATNLPFRVERILSEDDGSRINELDALDISLKKSNTDYYLVMYPGATLEDSEFFANIDEALNEKMERFCLILENGTRGIFVSNELHKKLRGNVPVSELFLNEGESGSKEVVFNSLKEKIEYLAKKDSHQVYIKKYEELCSQS